MALVGFLGVTTSSVKRAAAQPALDGEEQQTAVEGDKTDTPAEFGVGIRVRQIVVPRSIIELFVTEAPGGVSNTGGGVELTRRRGATELQLGFEYEDIYVTPGVWVQKGQSAATDEVDYVDFSKFKGWLTADVTFIHHTQLADRLALRYGAGGGIGLLMGKVTHIDQRCVGDSDHCADVNGGEIIEYRNLPPVFPVVNLIFGLQFKPSDKMTINLEAGLRTLPFFGLSSTYFF